MKKGLITRLVNRCVDITFIADFGQYPSNQLPEWVDVQSDSISQTDAEGDNTCCIAIVWVRCVVSCELMVSSTCEEVFSRLLL